jgi:hypothetical protein
MYPLLIICLPDFAEVSAVVNLVSLKTTLLFLDVCNITLLFAPRVTPFSVVSYSCSHLLKMPCLLTWLAGLCI